MGKGRVRPARDRNVERDAARAFIVQRLLKPPGNVPLGTPRERFLCEPLVHRVRDSRSAADLVELGRLLHGAQLLDDPIRRDQVETRAREGRMPSNREVVGLEGHRTLREAGQRGGNTRCELAVDQHRLDAFDLAGRTDVAPIREEDDLLVLHEHKRVRALKAAQIADIHRVRDEEALSAQTPELRSKPLHALVHSLSSRLCASNTSASR
jgi:hypothetical protein